MICLICDNKVLKSSKYPTSHPVGISFFKEIYFCPSCEFGIASPVKSQKELSELYSNGEYWDSIPDTNEFYQYQLSQCFFRYTKTKNYFTEKENLKILDIGAGNCPMGEVLNQNISNTNITYYYLEPDEAKKPRYSDNTNFKSVRITNLEEFNLQVDYIFINHVLEHIANPLEFLMQLKNHLVPSGRIYLETPFHDHLFRDEIFPHCNFFSPKSAQKISSKAGYKTIIAQSFGNNKMIDSKETPLSLINKAKLKIINILSRYRLIILTRVLYNHIYGFDKPKGNLWVYWILEK